MQVVLVMFKADGERRSFSLPRDVTIIGRREDCDLRIPLGEVSRKHCRIIRDADTVRLEDLGSSNGTFHNRTRIQECVLQPGDLVQIGPVSFVVQVDGMPADEDIQPPAAPAPRAAAAPQGRHDTSAAGVAVPPPTDATDAGEEEMVEFDPLEALESPDEKTGSGAPLEMNDLDDLRPGA